MHDSESAPAGDLIPGFGDMVPVKDDGVFKTFEIGGLEWIGWHEDVALSYDGRKDEGLLLELAISADHRCAILTATQNIGFAHEITCIETFPNLQMAAAAARVVAFETRVVGKTTWHLAGSGVWTAAFSRNDKGEVFEIDGGWSFRRTIRHEPTRHEPTSFAISDVSDQQRRSEAFDEAARRCTRALRELGGAAYQEGFEACRKACRTVLVREIGRINGS